MAPLGKRFRAIQTFLDALGQPDLNEKSRNFQAVMLREALDQAMPALARAGRAHQLKTTPTMRGPQLVRSLLTDLETILP